MNYPTFSDNGNINMTEVIDAKISDFVPDLTPEFILKELSDFIDFIKSSKSYCGDNHLQSNGYDKLFSDYIHDKIKQYQTIDGEKRKAGYTYSPEYCFWYNIFCKMIHNYPFHHCSEKDSLSYHVDLLESMIYVGVFRDKIDAISS
jgi:hypothetical protein